MRVSGLGSFFVSIALASISMFLTKLIFASQSIRFPLSTQAPETTDQFLYWGTIIVFLVVNAERIAKKLAVWGEDEPDQRKPHQEAENEAAAMLLVCPILLGIWAFAVWKGLGILITGQAS